MKNSLYLYKINLVNTSPEYSLLSAIQVTTQMPKQQITIPVFLPHLGCPHRCVFCDQKESTSVRQVPGPEYVDAIIESYLPHIKKSVRRVELAFFGGSFTGIKRDIQEAFLRAAHRHLEKKTIHGIRCSTRPDYISDEALELLQKYGVSTVELGVQSFDDCVLENSGRGHTASDVYAAIRCLENHGIDFIIQLMPGLVGDTRESSLRSAEKAASLHPSAVRIYPTVVLKGTGLDELYRTGRYAPLSLEEAVELCKEIYLLFSTRGIPVIRLGIHPFAPGEIANIVAGPYHPSFGYMVKARVRRDEMAACMKRHIGESQAVADRITIRIPGRYMEEYLGANRENIAFLKSSFNIDRIDYTIEDIPAVMIA
jgi:histone acetyltransferase (RNA polymerase elongator complex component)